MLKVSDGSNLINVENSKLCPKDRAIELQWYANEELGEKLDFQ